MHAPPGTARWRVASAARFRWTEIAASLDPSQEQENDNDDENKAEAAGRIVAPVAAVRPSRESADEEKNDDDEEDRSDNGTPMLRELASVDVRTTWSAPITVKFFQARPRSTRRPACILPVFRPGLRASSSAVTTPSGRASLHGTGADQHETNDQNAARNHRRNDMRRAFGGLKLQIADLRDVLRLFGRKHGNREAEHAEKPQNNACHDELVHQKILLLDFRIENDAAAIDHIDRGLFHGEIVLDRSNAGNAGGHLRGACLYLIAADDTAELDGVSVGLDADVEGLQSGIVEQRGLDLRGDGRVVDIFTGALRCARCRAAGDIHRGKECDGKRHPQLFLHDRALLIASFGSALFCR